MNKLATQLTAGAAALVASASAMAYETLDVSDATSYLDTNVSGAMVTIAGVVFGLSAIGMGIKWIKATFFA